jgi:hypothetical protein
VRAIHDQRPSLERVAGPVSVESGLDAPRSRSALPPLGARGVEEPGGGH